MTTAGQRLEALLRTAAADDAAWPATPNLRAAVVSRIRTMPLTAADGHSVPDPRSMPGARSVPDRRSPARLRPKLKLVRALAVALIALLVLAGIAAALGFGLPGVSIERVDRLPPAGTGFDLGSPVPLAEARNGEPPRVLVPTALPEPATAFVSGAAGRRMVTLAWRAGPGEPVLRGSDLSIAITAVVGRTDEVFMSKLLGSGTTIEAITVGGDRGWWIAGAPHDLFVMRPDGSAGILQSRLAGDTLVFVRDGTLYRLESALGRDATLEVATSLR